MIVDYGTLKTAIYDYSHRIGDTNLPVQTFVANCNAQINRRLRCRQMEQITTISSATKHFQLPPDFLELRAIYTDQGQIPAMLTPSQANSRGVSDTEFTYYIYSSSTIVNSIPGDLQDLEIIYYGKLSMFVNDLDTNAVLTNYPNIYLYGSMAEYCKYSEEDMENRGYWESLFSREIEEINKETKAAQYSGSPMAVRVY